MGDTEPTRVELLCTIRSLERALEWRGVIGQGMGILMERHRITADDAFAMLRTESQRRNCKLVVVAQDLVETGALHSDAFA